MGEWRAFEREFGPITLQQRLDANFALLAWRMAKMWGSTTTAVPADFMPLWSEARQAEQSDEAMMRAIEGVFRKT